MTFQKGTSLARTKPAHVTPLLHPAASPITALATPPHGSDTAMFENSAKEPPVDPEPCGRQALWELGKHRPEAQHVLALVR